MDYLVLWLCLRYCICL